MSKISKIKKRIFLVEFRKNKRKTKKENNLKTDKVKLSASLLKHINNKNLTLKLML